MGDSAAVEFLVRRVLFENFNDRPYDFLNIHPCSMHDAVVVQSRSFRANLSTCRVRWVEELTAHIAVKLRVLRI